jgi:PPOX class probable F420-dependent enzyme
MTTDERRAFLLHGTRTGKLATVRRNGAPHVAPVWFVLDGDDLVFTTHTETVKARTLRRDPRATLCVDDQTPPYSYVIVEGECSISEEPEALLRWAIRIGGRYMGEDQAEAFGRRNAVAGELLVHLRPTKIIANADVSA